MKKTLSLILALAMVFTIAACTHDDPPASSAPPEQTPSDSTPPLESTPPEESNALTDGYFTYAYSVEGMGDMVRYLHFYEDIGLGGVCFYASSGGGGTQSVIGFYTVEDKPFDYSCWATREERNSEGTGRTDGTAPQTITLTSPSGEAMGSVGYDGAYIYAGDEIVSNFVIADARNMRFGRDTENAYPDAYAAAYAAEVGQLLLKVHADGDATSFLEIYHNGTYSDMVNMMIEGTYTYAEAGGVKTYTLTPDDFSESPASLSVAADGSMTYTAGDGSTAAMVEDVEKLLFLSLTGPVTQTEYNMEAAYTMNLYEDGSCELMVDMAGNNVSADTGTYIIDASYDLVFTMGLLGELTAKGDFADPANPAYTLEVPELAAFNLSAATLVYGAQAKTVAFAFTGPVPQTAYNMEGTYTLNAYDDNTCELTVELAGNTAPVDAGTYRLNETYNFVFTLETLGELTTTADFSDPANPVYSLDVPAVEAFSLGEATIGYGQSEK